MKNKNLMKEHVKVRDQLRKQFQDVHTSDADLLFKSRKLFQPLSETITTAAAAATENIGKRTVAPSTVAAAIAAPPQLAAIEQKRAEVASGRDYAVIDPDTDLDLELIEDMGFIRPSKIRGPDKYDEIIDEVNNYNKYVLGRAKRGSTVSTDEKDIINKKLNANKEYVKRLRLLASGQNLVVKGKGLKLIGNKFGSLIINKDELARGRLRVQKDGSTVIDETVNVDDLPWLYNLLTKRFSKAHKYSKKAIEIFKKLVTLADIPCIIKRGVSRKLQLGRKLHGHEGTGVKYYNDPNDLVNRLHMLVASKSAGNTGLDNEISDIIDELQTKSYISEDLAMKLFKNNLS